MKQLFWAVEFGWWWWPAPSWRDKVCKPAQNPLWSGLMSCLYVASFSHDYTSSYFALIWLDDIGQSATSWEKKRVGALFAVKLISCLDSGPAKIKVSTVNVIEAISLLSKPSVKWTFSTTGIPVLSGMLRFPEITSQLEDSRFKMDIAARAPWILFGGYFRKSNPNPIDLY